MQNRYFHSYLAANVLLTLASSMLSVAVGWHIYQATGDPFDLALVGLMQILPIAGLFIVAGWVVDNVSRNRVLVVCTGLQAAAYFGLAVTIGGDSFNKAAVFSLLFLTGVSRVFLGPAMQSALPRLVASDRLQAAVAVSSTAWTTAGTAGPFLAGLFIAWFDTGVYWVLGGFAGLAGAFFLALPALTVVRSVGRGVTQLMEGIRFVVRNPYVLPSITLDLFIVLVGSVVALLPVYAIDILEVGPESLGLLRAMPALGAVIAGVAISRFDTLRKSGVRLFVALLVFALSVLVFALSGLFWLSLLALFVYGASDMVSVNIRMTLIQLATPDKLRGRVNSVNSLFIATSNDLGDFRAGAVATILGPVATVLAGGVMALCVALGGYLLFPKLRALDRLADAEYRESPDEPAAVPGIRP